MDALPNSVYSDGIFKRSLIIRTVPGLPAILPILLARMDGLCPTSMPIPAAPLPAALDLAMLLFMAAAWV